MAKILLVDDEPEILDLIEIYLLAEGYDCIKCVDAKNALTIIKNNRIDLAILDVMLPDMSGFELCREIRKNEYFPIIMVTAKVESQDKIMGLTFGADDYVVKPFDPLELITRIKTQLRRYKKYNQKEKNEDILDINIIEIRGLRIEKDTHHCYLNEQIIELTPIEFELLWYLCCHEGQVVSSEELFEAVWKEKYFESNNTVMTHISRLREKMYEVPRHPKYIQTVWGVGYKIEK